MATPGKKPSKGAPPKPGDAQSPVVGNATSKPEAGELVMMNLRVSPEFRRRVRTFAAEHDMSMADVAERGMEMFMASKGKG